MSRILPGKPAQQRGGQKDEGSLEECDNPECLARQVSHGCNTAQRPLPNAHYPPLLASYDIIFYQDRYRELADANVSLRTQYEELELSLKMTLNKLQLMDKANKLAEDANDKLQEQLDEIRGRTSILEVEGSEGQKVNSQLKTKLSVSQDGPHQPAVPTPAQYPARHIATPSHHRDDTPSHRHAVAPPLQGLETEIATLRKQAEERRIAKEEAERSSASEVVFAPRGDFRQTHESLDVAALEKWSFLDGQGFNQPGSNSSRASTRKSAGASTQVSDLRSQRRSPKSKQPGSARSTPGRPGP